MISITKKCNICKREKDSRLFGIHPHEKICRACISEYNIFTEKPENCRGHRNRWVYFISGAGLTKIGIADNVKSRIKTLRTGSPVSLSLSYSFQSDDALSIESSLHRKYSKKRIHGEWFNLSTDDIEWIKSNY